MDERHEANRRHWDASAAAWRELRDRDGLWKVCPSQPQLAFEGEALEQINQAFPDLRDRRVCVVGSGDNYAAFALAAAGAHVTSVDISEQQLAIARERAQILALNIEFVRADATELSALHQGSFDLVVSTNGLFVWISDLAQLFAAVHGILRQHGSYVFYDVHPFLRPWLEQMSPLSMEKPYWDTGPFVYEDMGRHYEFHWTIEAIVNSLAGAGFVLKRIRETAAKSPRFWQNFSYGPSSETEWLDWKKNPRAGLPSWLTVAAKKP